MDRAHRVIGIVVIVLHQIILLLTLLLLLFFLVLFIGWLRVVLYKVIFALRCIVVAMLYSVVVCYRPRDSTG